MARRNHILLNGSRKIKYVISVLYITLYFIEITAISLSSCFLWLYKFTRVSELNIQKEDSFNKWS